MLFRPSAAFQEQRLTCNEEFASGKKMVEWTARIFIFLNPERDCSRTIFTIFKLKLLALVARWPLFTLVEIHEIWYWTSELFTRKLLYLFLIFFRNEDSRRIMEVNLLTAWNSATFFWSCLFSLFLGEQAARAKSEIASRYRIAQWEWSKFSMQAACVRV